MTNNLVCGIVLAASDYLEVRQLRWIITIQGICPCGTTLGCKGFDSLVIECQLRCLAAMGD
jgi:hypothetical protein